MANLLGIAVAFVGLLLHTMLYADFLEECGDDGSAARADLIRVQIQLAARAPLRESNMA